MSRSFVGVVVGGVVVAIWVIAIWRSGDAEHPGSFPPDAPIGVEPPAQAPPPPAAATTTPSVPGAAAPLSPPASPAPSAEPAAPRPPAAQGPVVERKARYQAEPRPSNARAIEAAVEAAFKHPEIDPALLRRVTCRDTVCKVEARWTEQRAIGVMVLMMGLPQEFSLMFAMEPTGEPDADGVSPVDFYLERKIPPNGAVGQQRRTYQ